MPLEVVCLCGRNDNEFGFMIQCDFCKTWFHGRCVGIREYQAVDIDRFHCPRCEQIHGPSVLKPRLNWHRHDYSEADASDRPMQTGTHVFIKELKTRFFPGSEDIVLKLKGDELTCDYFLEKGFNRPILVENREGLDLIVPESTFSVHDVENYVGIDHEIDVIDVQRQTNVKMQLHEFVEYFLSPARTTVLNLISLEFSRTNLSPLVEPPLIVRKLCWVTSAWPSDPPPPPPLSRPNVNKYCLVSVENSYTDFHIDFGGTSVWYHVLWGEKIFYLIKPTMANLSLYQRWMKAHNQSEMFFGDQVDVCHKCRIKAGETLFIPTGWIHAVLTPTDTLVFGGNFLNSHNIELQLQIYEMEKQFNTPMKYRFPSFETVCWYAAVHLVKELRELSTSRTRVPSHIISGSRTLMGALRHWAGETGTGGLECPPHGIQPLKLLKEFQKEIRTAERQIVALNPPKPERESKRRKKKVLSKDFIDYTDLTSFDSAIEECIPKKRDSEENYFKDQDRASFTIIKSERAESELDSKRNAKLNHSKLNTYPYGVGIGLSGTPPHDPSYPAFKNEYPSNVNKTEFDWHDGSSPALKLLNTNTMQFRLTHSGLEDAVSSRSPTSGRASSPYFIKHKLGGSLSEKSTDSIYEFNDAEGSDEEEPPELMIDESPRRKSLARNSNLQQSLKLRLNLNEGEVIYDDPLGVAQNILSTNSLQHLAHINHNSCNNSSHNGIEELLRASKYAPYLEGAPAYVEEIETGRASPSTREAIAGMLSMSAVVPGSRTPGRKLSSAAFNCLSSARHLKSKRRYVEDEGISKVHQDEDYVYPSLDLSDDEDFPVFKPRGKKKEDEPWNPKARIRVCGPKPERPTRQGAKKESVGKGLEQAAARRQNLPMPKRPYQRRKIRQEPQPVSAITAIKSSTSSTIKISSKPKKGMATAKQRLGKILKIHKMLH